MSNKNDKDSVFEILKSALKDRSVVYISAQNLDVTFETKIVSVHDDHIVLLNKISPPYISRAVVSKKFGLQVQMLRFEADSITTDGENIIFPLKENSLIVDTRQAERFPFSKEERVICEILNPYDTQTILKKTIIDMSATGLSLRTSFESKLFSAGMIFDELRVLIDGKPYTKTKAKVVYQRKLMDFKGLIRLQISMQFI
jgi:hypothetical protein